MSEPTRDPLHGTTLQAILEFLVDQLGWETLGNKVPIRCFLYEPSLSSSLKFLRRTPWARDKVEALYVREKKTRDRKRARNRRRKEHRQQEVDVPLERPETLALVWPAGADVPEAVVPEGYSIEHGVNPRAFRAVQAAIGFEVTEEAWRAIRLVRGAMVLATHPSGPVAVAVAEPREAGWVEPGWVAVAPEHRGKGLGATVCRTLVASLLEQGHDRIFGSTQDARIQALRIYMEMGFEPVERPEKAERWAAVLALLD